MAEPIASDTKDQTIPSGDVASSAAPSSEPASSQSGGNEGTPSSSAGPASSSPTGSQGSGESGAGQAPAGNYVSVRDAAYQQYGLDLRHLPDDEAAFRYLIGQASQASQAQQYAQRYLQHAGQFEQWLSSQQQAQQTQRPAGFWNPPEFNPQWKQLVSRDPDTGEFKVAPGAPPDVLPKYLAYEQYRRDWVEKLTSDPVNALQPLIQQQAQQIAEAQIQRHLGSYQETVYADNFVAQNSNWLHMRDAQGQMVVDPVTRGPLLSPAGQRFKGYVEVLHNSGVTNLKLQEQMARGMVERDIAMARLSQLEGDARNQQQKNQFLAQNNVRQPNQSGVLSPGGNASPDNQRASLESRLLARLKEAGVTDADFQAVR